MKNPAAVALGRLGASKGGVARAQKLSRIERREIARKGGRAATVRWTMQTIGAKFSERVLDDDGNRIETESLRRVLQLFRARVKVFGRRALFYKDGRLWDGRQEETEKFRGNVVGVYDDRATVDSLLDDLTEIF